MEQDERLNLVMSVLAAIPEDLAKDRYLSQLAGWVAGVSSSDARTIAAKRTKEHTLWLGIYRTRLESYLHSGCRLPANLLNPTAEGSSHSPGTIDGEGRNLCLLGLIITESFALRKDREQVRGMPAFDSRVWFHRSRAGAVTCHPYSVLETPNDNHKCWQFITIFIVASPDAFRGTVAASQSSAQVLARALHV